MPIWSIVCSKRFDSDQLPVCVSVTATNDWATGWAYPLGSWLRIFNERWLNAREREALTHTMGHLPWMRTHELTIASQSESDNAAAATSPIDVGRRRADAQAALLQLAKGGS